MKAAFHYLNLKYISRFFSAIAVFCVLTSCEDQVKFNNPAVQALKDNVLWSSTLFTAVQSSDGSLTIEAYQKNDILTLKTGSIETKTYILGDNDINKVELVTTKGDAATVFSTSENIGNGQIIIKEVDATNHTITGEFKFNAKNESVDPLAVKSVSFTKGIFYRVPVTIEAGVTKNF